MEGITVPLENSPYEVLIGEGLLPTSGTSIREACGGGKRCVIVTDSNVGPLYSESVSESLRSAGAAVEILTVPAGENSKSMACVEDLCERMIAAGLDRKSFLVALGGGVIGDLAGFVAAVFHRGIPYAQLPTTVLAQVDSSVGGKTGVNARAGKNLIGAFHQPRIVVADTACLSTLAPREFNEGMAEIIKHGIIRDASLVSDAVPLSHSNLPVLIARNVGIKASIVSRDEFETKGLRALLNFGHTVGHAIEQTAGYGRYLHGEAISIGMAVALRISERHAGLSAEESSTALSALAELGLPTAIPANLPTASLLDAMERDKKFDEGRIRFVVSPALGSAEVRADVTRSQIADAIDATR